MNSGFVFQWWALWRRSGLCYRDDETYVFYFIITIRVCWRNWYFILFLSPFLFPFLFLYFLLSFPPFFPLFLSITLFSLDNLASLINLYYNSIHLFLLLWTSIICIWIYKYLSINTDDFILKVRKLTVLLTNNRWHYSPIMPEEFITTYLSSNWSRFLRSHFLMSKNIYLNILYFGEPNQHQQFSSISSMNWFGLTLKVSWSKKIK